MPNETPDRQQMHEDLRELAKLAATPAPNGARDKAHGFESADSSGYVDLSAYRADDESWIERELARAKTGTAPSPRPIDALSPQSMAPVALEALLAADDAVEEEAAPRRRWPLVLGGIASAAAVAGLAVAVMHNAPHAPKAQAAALAPPPVATQAVSTPEPAVNPAQPAVPSTSPSPTPSATAVASTATTDVPSEAATKKPHVAHAARAHAPASSPAVAAAKPAAAHPAASPVAVPASHPAKSSGDPLMDAIRAAVKK